MDFCGLENRTVMLLCAIGSKLLFLPESSHKGEWIYADFVTALPLPI